MPRGERAHVFSDHARGHFPHRRQSTGTRGIVLSALGAASAGAVASVGRGGVCARPGGGQAHPAGHRRGVVPLVPRDGRRVVRRPRDGAIINQHFVAVKVDRDERPDVDARYQAAVSAISGQGGWPLTAFLTPDGRPYFGGTYFPRDDRYGRPGLWARAADHGAGVEGPPRRSAGVGRQRDGGHRAQRELFRRGGESDAGPGGQDCRLERWRSSIRATAASVRSPSFPIRRRSTCCWKWP